MKVDSRSVSVIIPVFNCATYLEEAIRSVFNQTVPVGEVIVVDDGSTDHSRDIAAGFAPRLTCLHQPHAGLAAARNLGVRTARGDFIAHLDADDLWLPHKIERQLRAFAADPELEIVGGQIQNFFSPELDPDTLPPVHCHPEPLPGFSASVQLVRRSTLKTVGFFDTQWVLGGDLDWFMRAREQGIKEALIPEVLVKRRLHLHNISFVKREHAGERIQVLRAALERRRGKAPEVAG